MSFLALPHTRSECVIWETWRKATAVASPEPPLDSAKVEDFLPGGRYAEPAMSRMERMVFAALASLYAASFPFIFLSSQIFFRAVGRWVRGRWRRRGPLPA